MRGPGGLIVKKRRQISRARAPETITEPNMTPLIDVSLVLVVILMVATPLAFQSSIGVHTATTTGAAAQAATRAERIEVEVMADGSVKVNRFVVPREAFARTLQPLIRDQAGLLVVVRCEPGVTHGAFVGVLDEARELGASRLAVVGG